MSLESHSLILGPWRLRTDSEHRSFIFLRFLIHPRATGERVEGNVRVSRKQYNGDAIHNTTDCVMRSTRYSVKMNIHARVRSLSGVHDCHESLTRIYSCTIATNLVHRGK